ncbi:MAG: class II fumarate hydratase [Pseudomonadota bacterium]
MPTEPDAGAGNASETREERDSLGSVAVPRDALWGAQTQRAIDNFRYTGDPMPTAFLRAVVQIKAAAARANARAGAIADAVADAIVSACDQVLSGAHDDQFPVEVFQTGSGTSTNMNVNEVLATLASRALGSAVHPNDQVNASQSSNDVIPSAIHVSAVDRAHAELLPALEHLAETIRHRAAEQSEVVKTGRTHLMDAMPLSLEQEFEGWAAQVDGAAAAIRAALYDCHALPQGGTAVGTGINTPPAFTAHFIEAINARTGLDFRGADNRFAGLASQDAAVGLSGALKRQAVALLKIANDLRWMNSGPLAGLGEIALPALQPGSSIMPGKVNPVVPEAVAMACAQVIGNDTAITVAGQSGNFQLNVMLPLVARNLLESIRLLGASARALADQAIAGLTVNRDRLEAALGRNPILVTALNQRIGYDAAAQIAKQAYAEGRPVIDVAVERTDLRREELERLLDPRQLI